MATKIAEGEEEQDERPGLLLHCLPDHRGDVVALDLVTEGPPLQEEPDHREDRERPDENKAGAQGLIPLRSSGLEGALRSRDPPPFFSLQSQASRPLTMVFAIRTIQSMKFKVHIPSAP